MTAEQSYRIVVVGELGDWLERYVGAARIEAAEGVTTITGSLQDPTELQTLTTELCDLGLEIERATLDLGLEIERATLL
jgi:hypothetical protein